MSEQFKLEGNLTIHVISDELDPLLTKEFYNNLYNNVFANKDNNLKAGLITMRSVADVEYQIVFWLNGSSKYMFFMYNGKNIVGTTQAFKSSAFDDDTLSLGYIMSPQSQGKGYGTMMLKFVSSYLHDKNIKVVLGFRDGNVASERIAVKSNYSYLMRTSTADAKGVVRPITFYKYNGTTIVNEGYDAITSSKILTTNQWIDDKDHILSRVNPKMLSLDEYVYFSTSANKPIALNETYFLFTTAHYGLTDRLKKEGIKSKTFGLTDKASKNLFDPSVKGDIVLNKFYSLLESDLRIFQISDDKTSMILGNDIGEARVRVIGTVLMVEDFVLTAK